MAHVSLSDKNPRKITVKKITKHLKFYCKPIHIYYIANLNFEYLFNF